MGSQPQQQQQNQQGDANEGFEARLSRYGINTTWNNTEDLNTESSWVASDHETWTKDLRDLGVRHVRLAIERQMRITPTDPTSSYTNYYRGWKGFLEACSNSGLSPLVVLNSGISPNDSPDYFNFPNRAGEIAADLGALANTYEIWNE